MDSVEMAQHKALTVATGVKVYFCDPQGPWQRGTNEYTNLFLRLYFSEESKTASGIRLHVPRFL